MPTSNCNTIVNWCLHLRSYKTWTFQIKCGYTNYGFNDGDVKWLDYSLLLRKTKTREGCGLWEHSTIKTAIIDFCFEIKSISGDSRDARKQRSEWTVVMWWCLTHLIQVAQNRIRPNHPIRGTLVAQNRIKPSVYINHHLIQRQLLLYSLKKEN